MPVRWSTPGPYLERASVSQKECEPQACWGPPLPAVGPALWEEGVEEKTTGLPLQMSVQSSVPQALGCFRSGDAQMMLNEPNVHCSMLYNKQDIEVT